MQIISKKSNIQTNTRIFNMAHSLLGSGRKPDNISHSSNYSHYLVHLSRFILLFQLAFNEILFRPPYIKSFELLKWCSIIASFRTSAAIFLLCHYNYIICGWYFKFFFTNLLLLVKWLDIYYVDLVESEVLSRKIFDPRFLLMSKKVRKGQYLLNSQITRNLLSVYFSQFFLWKLQSVIFDQLVVLRSGKIS